MHFEASKSVSCCYMNRNKGIPQPGTRPPPGSSPTPKPKRQAPPVASPTPRSKAKAAAEAALKNNAPLTPGVLTTQEGGQMPAALRYSPMRKMYYLHFVI